MSPQTRNGCRAKGGGARSRGRRYLTRRPLKNPALVVFCLKRRLEGVPQKTPPLAERMTGGNLARPVGTWDRFRAVADDAFADPSPRCALPTAKPIFGGRAGNVCAILTMRRKIVKLICDHQNMVVAPALECGPGHVSIFFSNPSDGNIDQRQPEDHGDCRIAAVWWLQVAGSFTLPPERKVKCHDRLPRRNPIACRSGTPLPEMPDAHDARAHLARAYRIRTSHLRLRPM
jgi:hypothetical protein